LEARGGSGEVYKATDEKNQPVALKVLLPSVCSDETRLLRFYQEAHALLSIDHPYILRCLEVGEAEGRHFMATEWVKGANLVAWVCQKGLFSERRALKVIAAVARGLAAVHGAGLLHRDISPNNVMLSQSGRVTLIDFEFCKSAIADLGLTQEGVGLGRADYISPEQLTNAKQVDERSDIYALGSTLYAILTNRLPFPGASYSQKWEAKCNDLYIPARKFAPHVSDATENLIAGMMAADPQQRFPTAVEAARATEEVLYGLDRDSHAVNSRAGVTVTQPHFWRITSVLPSGEVGGIDAFEVEVREMLLHGQLPITAHAARGGVPPFRPISEIPEFRGAAKGAGSSQRLNSLARTGRLGCSELLKQFGGTLTSMGKSLAAVPQKARR
jgi:serine/threonine-protein kinase